MRYLYALLLLSLACRPAEQRPSTLNQSAFRTPPRPPIFTPAEDAPHTVGQPGHVRPGIQVEPGPRPKALPHTPQTRREDTIWASDGALDGKSVTLVLGVPITLPDKPSEAPARRHIEECANVATDVARAHHPDPDYYRNLGKDAHECIALKMLHKCLEWREHRLSRDAQLRSRKPGAGHARLLVDPLLQKPCFDQKETATTVNRVLGPIFQVWDGGGQ